MLDPQLLDDQLLEALTHLYDPDYAPPQPLLELTCCDPQTGATPFQARLRQAIKALAPQEDIPSDAHLRRVYEVIHCRFVLRLTQEATAERMGLSVRHLNRVQREAVHTLAQHLWEQGASEGQQLEHAETTSGPADTNDSLQAADWQTQTQREFASLQASSPHITSDVSIIMRDVLELPDALWSGSALEARIGHVMDGLEAKLHPSVLRQMLIAALGRLNRAQRQEPITVFAALEDGNVRITLSTTLPPNCEATASDLVEGMLSPDTVAIESRIDDCNVFVTIRAPSATPTVTVLVVDDNVDMVRFYRRASIGTPYEIVHFEAGNNLLAIARKTQPDIIVSDVMLPEQDGWHLLMQLHQDPLTRAIPVVVCTVVREPELARSLGAAHYLAKPVRPRAFIQALDTVLQRD